MIILRRFLLLVVAAFIVWRVGASGLSAHYVERLEAGERDAAAKALAWDPRQPEALYAQALSLREEDPDAAASLFARAYAQNPADSRPLVATARMVLDEGDADRADAMVKAAVELTPADPRIHRQAAAYWISRGELTLAMRHLSLTLETSPAYREELFPRLLKIAEDSGAWPAFRPLALSPPSWWGAFFAEVSKRSLDVETVRLLYALRRESSQTPLTEEERKAYVARLKKDGLITEAYIEWINGLTRGQRDQLGLLHDGGFELEPTNWGFDWHLGKRRGVIVDQARTYGVKGERALHVIFKDLKRPFRDISQPLFLDPGTYRLDGKVRTDSLETKGGLKWVVRCLLPEVEQIGESERFLGANQWRGFGFEFEVEESCGLQEIRLVSAGKRAFEYEITGGAWFDGMAIRRVAHTEG